MSEMKILHYTIKYQDRNIAIVRFSRKEVSDFLRSSIVFLEGGSEPNLFWERFEETLLEISGVLFAILDGYEITIIKEIGLSNWGKIIENVIWASVLFLNPNGGAIEVSSRNRKIIGKLIIQRFDATEPEYPRYNKK